LQPRKQYNRLREEFAQLVVKGDYKGILKVFNHKPMLPDSELHLMLGYHSKEEYISAVIKAMRGNGKDARRLRSVVRTCLKWEELKIDNNN
jgi:hypothetical protein